MYWSCFFNLSTKSISDFNTSLRVWENFFDCRFIPAASAGADFTLKRSSDRIDERPLHSIVWCGFYKTSVETLVTFFSTRGKSEGDLVGGLREYCWRLEHQWAWVFFLTLPQLGYSIPKSVYTSHGICPDFKNVVSFLQPTCQISEFIELEITRPSTVRFCAAVTSVKQLFFQSFQLC